ncbi:MAG: SRPBCC domain-containing protein [Hyphomonadaceae bacterium]|nr:SRPBCC domain-containing protein [Hyphomonadaceae bacterium]
MQEATLVKTIYLQATLETVWSYLTQPDRLARWFHESDTALDKVGKEYKLLRDNPSDKGPVICWGEVLEVDKPNRLVHTFTHEWLKGAITTVVWELMPVDGGTQVTMTHSDLDAMHDGLFDQLSGHDKGWDEGFIRLRRVAATY